MFAVSLCALISKKFWKVSLEIKGDVPSKYAYTCVCVHVCVYVYVCMSVCMHMCMCVHVCATCSFHFDSSRSVTLLAGCAVVTEIWPSLNSPALWFRQDREHDAEDREMNILQINRHSLRWQWSLRRKGMGWGWIMAERTMPICVWK